MESNNLLQKLKKWRRMTANREGVELFRVFQNKTLEDIARLKPTNKEYLLAIKGIREKKFEKYGRDILNLVNGGQKNIEPARNEKIGEDPDKGKKPYTVSGYLDLLNNRLREQKAHVQGEISGLNIKENYLFFSLKDKKDSSVLNCFMWEKNYELCGISFKEGMEIIVEGSPEVYKPSGRLSLKVFAAELVGEGALKKAYDQLKKRLEKEGLFAMERKKPIPEFPQKIGLITSETGAVIHDFQTNLGQYGYQIKFMNSRVEGQAAVGDLLSAIDYFKGKGIDVLVVIRGGGSFESLQAFNNEVLVRKIADFNIPVICGIGHERDVPLVSLVADLMVSTPTATAVVLNKSWERALDRIKIFEQDIINKYQQALGNRKHQFEILGLQLREKADFIFERFATIKSRLGNKLEIIGHGLKEAKKTIVRSSDLLLTNFQKKIDWLADYFDKAEKQLNTANPMRQLKLGYSIALVKDKIVKSIKQVRTGDEIDVLVSDGKIKSQVNSVNS